MRRSLSIAAAAGLVIAMLVAAGASGRATKTVDVADDFFDPAKVTIKEKNKLAFNWIGANEHDIAKTKGPGKFFESGPIQGSGVLYTKKFSKAGKYTLICTLHDDMDMKVVVKD